MHTFFLIVLGTLGLGFGMANPLLQFPFLALLYPASLAGLGFAAPRAGTALRRGWLAGLCASTAGLYWLALPVHEFGYLPWVLAVPCALAIAAYVGLYGGLFALCAHLCREVLPGRRALILGLVWFFLEWLRGSLFTGFPWLVLASAFSPWPVWIQGASVVGAYGLGGVFAGLACLGLTVLPGLAPEESHPFASRRASPAWPVLGCLAAFSLLAGFGAWRLEREPLEQDAAIGVALIQGNVNQDQKWSPPLQEATLDRYLELSSTALRQTPSPSLLIWPETAMPFRFNKNPGLAARARAFARQNGIGLVLGTLGEGEGPLALLYNRAMLIGPEGEAGWYDKVHLVPFGEYAPPWLDLPFLQPLMQGVGTFTPGAARVPPALPLRSRDADAASGSAPTALVPGLLICYETIFPELARDRVAEGANMLINISNDAWFGRSSAPEQHLQLGLLRAVEQGRPLARATNTGISAFVDPYGRVLGQGGLFLTEALNGELHPVREHTLFFRFEPYLLQSAAVLLLLAVVAGLLGSSPGRSRRRWR